MTPSKEPSIETFGTPSSRPLAPRPGDLRGTESEILIKNPAGHSNHMPQFQQQFTPQPKTNGQTPISYLQLNQQMLLMQQQQHNAHSAPK